MLKRFIHDTRRYFDYTLYAAKAELKDRISSSYLSWAWLFLEPFCFMLIYTFIVRVVFQSDEAFLPVFVFIGLTMWNFFNKTVMSSIKLVRYYRGVITKTYVPKFVLLYVRMIINGFEMMISWVIVLGMLIVFKVPFTWNMLYFFPLMVLLCVGTFGASAILLHFGTYIDDLTNVVNIIMRLLFYLSGIFYSLRTRVPAPLGGWLVYYNPVAYVIDEMRNVLLFGQGLYFKWYFAWLIVCLLISAVGVALIYRHENKYAKVI